MQRPLRPLSVSVTTGEVSEIEFPPFYRQVKPEVWWKKRTQEVNARVGLWSQRKLFPKRGMHGMCALKLGLQAPLVLEPQGAGASTRPLWGHLPAIESARPARGPSVSVFLQLQIQPTKKCATLYDLLLKTILSGSNLCCSRVNCTWFIVVSYLEVYLFYSY